MFFVLKFLGNMQTCPRAAVVLNRRRLDRNETFYEQKMIIVNRAATLMYQNRQKIHLKIVKNG